MEMLIDDRLICPAASREEPTGLVPSGFGVQAA